VILFKKVDINETKYEQDTYHYVLKTYIAMWKILSYEFNLTT
jgi:hypothetical protein